MATENLSSAAIANIDAAPPVRGTGGLEGSGKLESKLGSVQPSNGVTLGSVYRLARVPSNCSIKHVLIEETGTITTLTGDITLYYSDETLDQTGSSQGNSGLVNSLSGASALFATAFATTATGVITDVVDKAGNYPPPNRVKKLWQAAGLASDPGGYFDVVMVTTATNSLTAGANLSAEVQFTMPLS